MMKPKVLTAMILLLSMVLGIFCGPVGAFSPASAKAATQAPQIDISKPIDSIIQIPHIPIKEVTDPPIFKKPDLDLLTMMPRLPLYTPEPDEPDTTATPKPSTGGGKYLTSEGPLFLSFRSDLTEQLYMFTPMDLSIDGEFHFPLIGSSLQVVGDAKVTVASGMVTVNYFLVNGVKVDPDDEFFTFFKDIDSITTVRPSRLKNVRLKFGIPYNVENRLKSDPNVLLYINCPVSYKTSLKGLSPFSFDSQDYIQKVNELVLLMD